MKKRRRPVLKAFLLVALLIVLSMVGYYQTVPRLSDDRLASVEHRVWDDAFRIAADSGLTRARSIAQSLELPSVTFAAAVDGRIVWEASVGWSDLSARLAASPETQYRTGSVAMSITSVILGRLAASGAIDLDSPVRTYLPEAVGPVGDATIRQIAGHMSGVRHYARRPGRAVLTENFNRTHFDEARTALDLFLHDSLLFAPGTGFAYSTHGFTLLSAALESASGRPFLVLLDEEVVKPGGLVGTGPDDVTVAIPDRAVTYVQVGERYIDPPDADPSYKWAGGGLLATAGDLARLGSALMDHELLESAFVEELWTPQRMPDGSANPQNYGMGWRIDRESGLIGRRDTVRVIHHGGASPGGSAFLLLVPADRVAIAVLTNRSLDNPGPLRREAYWAAGAFARAHDSTRAPVVSLDAK
jgi:CubicO group peptidase (beta-lactamase class C family)